MQAPFHYMLGPGILAARAAVAVASTLGGLLFYFLLRRTAGQWVALSAFFLLAVSPADMMASRLANVESHVKLWSIMPLFFLFLGFDQLKTAWFALAGISLGLALLTYDTLAPILGLVAVLFVVEAIRRPKAGIVWVKGLLAIAIPLAFALPTAFEYLAGRGPYYDLATKGWGGVLISRLFDGLSDLLSSIFLMARNDFLFVRQGPLL